MSEAGKDSQKAKKPSKLRQRSSGFFSRSGRNSISTDRGLDSRSGTPGPLLLDVLPKSDTTLTEDKSLSQYFSAQRTPVILEHPGQANADYGRTSTAVSNGGNASQYSRTATMLSRHSNETSAPSDYQYQSTILTLQTKIMTESQEKEAILAKYQALAKIHDAQQTELTTARASLRKGDPSNGASAPIVASASKPHATRVAQSPQPEAHLQEQLQSLITQLHAVIISHVKESEVDMAKATPENEAIIKSVTPNAASAAEVPKIALLQALTTFTLFNALQDPLFPGLSGKYESLQASDALLKTSASPAQYNQWRTATATALLSGEDASLKDSTDAFVTHLTKSIDGTLATLSPSADKSESRQEQLKPLIISAVTLARQVKAQNADLDFQLPVATLDKSTSFDGSLMDKVAAAGAPSQAKTVQLVLSPVAYYVSRDAASSEAAKTVVQKAKVLCKD